MAIFSWRSAAIGVLGASVAMAIWMVMWPGAALANTTCDVTDIQAIFPSSSPVTIISATQESTPSFCEVVGAIKTESDGETGKVEFKLGLPDNGNEWNHLFLFVGGGGFQGTLQSVTGEVAAGFATAVTDTGHESSFGPLSALDGSFGLNADGSPNLPGREDFAVRAVHLSTLAARSITTSFYSGGLVDSYFDGCSTGGRQALVEAQKFPLDFNGIVAGDPAIGDPIAGFNWNQQALLAKPDSWLSPKKIELVDKAVLKECDGRDGVVDGLIQDPRKCNFHPESLECSGGDTSNCLTADQVTALKKIYAGARGPHHKQLYPGYTVSDPGGADGWSLWITGFYPPTFPIPSEPWGTPPTSFVKAPFEWSFQDQFMKYFVFDDPTFNSLTFNFSSAKELAKLNAIVSEFGGNGVNPDLSPFFEDGGKLIMYHGWSDPALTPLISIKYYTSVARKLGGGFHHLQKYARLFMVPGMHHCGGGPGPNVFDPLTPLINWTQGGKAPAEIPASHNNPNTGTVRSFPLCPYPETAVFQGGDVTDAANWKCSAHTNHRFFRHLEKN